MNPAQYYYALRSILPKNLYNDARLASRKRECRAYLPSKVDPLAESLRKLPRKHIDEGGECCTEYRIVTDPMKYLRHYPHLQYLKALKLLLK